MNFSFHKLEDQLHLTPSLAISRGYCPSVHCTAQHYAVRLAWIFWAVEFVFSVGGKEGGI